MVEGARLVPKGYLGKNRRFSACRSSDMSVLRLKRGHDITLEGCPEKKLVNPGRPFSLAVCPPDFRGIRPKMMAKEGDHVRRGQPLFYCKDHDGLVFTAPGSGTISRIVYGERRSLRKVIIDTDRIDSCEEFKAFKEDRIPELKPETVRSILLQSGLWPVIRERPFSSVANPGRKPKAVFVPAMSTAPFAPDVDFILEHDGRGFQAGLTVLRKLAGSPVHLVMGEHSTSPLLSGAQDVTIHRVSGPHPAGNVGIHIHHILPIRHRDDIVWYVSLQDVLRIGRLFLDGRLPVEKIVTVGGLNVEKRGYVKVKQGMMLRDILEGNAIKPESRLISGDVLTGFKSVPEDFLGFYHDTISVIPENNRRDFFGWLSPGRHSYSVTNLFVSKLFNNSNTAIDTRMHGSPRVIIPFGNIESVLPMDLLPTFLIKMILARDIDEMEKLGIYECDPEDFALCSFVDASKMEISDIIRQGLEYVQKNG